MVYERGSAVLQECTASNCGMHKVSAEYEGSRLEVDACTLQQNGRIGAFASMHAVVEMRGCSSSGHKAPGYVLEIKFK